MFFERIIVRRDLDIRVEGAGVNIESLGVIRLGGIGFRDFGVGAEEGCEVLESKGRVVGAVEGVMIKMEYSFSGCGGCGGDDGFR